MDRDITLAKSQLSNTVGHGRLQLWRRPTTSAGGARPARQLHASRWYVPYAPTLAQTYCPPHQMSVHTVRACDSYHVCTGGECLQGAAQRRTLTSVLTSCRCAHVLAAVHCHGLHTCTCTCCHLSVQACVRCRAIFFASAHCLQSSQQACDDGAPHPRPPLSRRFRARGAFSTRCGLSCCCHIVGVSV